MSTPLYGSLRALAETRPLRLDMPGHHGTPLPGGFPWPSELDFTENGATGDLFGDEPDAIQAAEGLWAARFGFDACLFLTGGSTQGVHAGLALLAGAGGAIEKAFQPGGDRLRAKGIRVEALARVKFMSEETGVVFVDERPL